MAKANYAVVGGQTKKIKKQYGVIGGQTRKIKKVYDVVGGKTRLCWSSADGIFAIAHTESSGSKCYYFYNSERELISTTTIHPPSGYYYNYGIQGDQFVKFKGKYYVATSLGIAYSTDLVTWTEVATNTDGYFTLAIATDGNYLYRASSRGNNPQNDGYPTIFMTSNGTSWSYAFQSSFSTTYYRAVYGTNKGIWMCLGDGELRNYSNGYLTCRSGTTVVGSVGDTVAIPSVRVHSNGVITAQKTSTSNGYLFCSTNNGATFTARDIGTSSYDVVYICGYYYILFNDSTSAIRYTDISDSSTGTWISNANLNGQYLGKYHGNAWALTDDVINADSHSSENGYIWNTETSLEAYSILRLQEVK